MSRAGSLTSLWTFFSASAASETENPRRNISRAVRRVFWRILIFYVLGILITGMLVPYNDPDLLNGTGTAAESPYVIAIRRAGIHTLPSIINAVVFTSAFSAANSFLFCSSRILYGLSIRGQAPRVFSYCTKNGLPIVAVLTSVRLSFRFRRAHMKGSICALIFLFFSHSELFLRPIFYERIFRRDQGLQVRLFFLSSLLGGQRVTSLNHPSSLQLVR